MVGCDLTLWSRSLSKLLRFVPAAPRGRGLRSAAQCSDIGLLIHEPTFSVLPLRTSTLPASARRSSGTVANLRFASYGCCRTTISPLQARGWAGKASHRLQVTETNFPSCFSMYICLKRRSPCRDGSLTTVADRSHAVCQEKDFSFTFTGTWFACTCSPCTAAGHDLTGAAVS